MSNIEFAENDQDWGTVTHVAIYAQSRWIERFLYKITRGRFGRLYRFVYAGSLSGDEKTSFTIPGCFSTPTITLIRGKSDFFCPGGRK